AVESEIRKLVAQKMDAERRIGKTGLSITRRRKEAVPGAQPSPIVSCLLGIHLLAVVLYLKIVAR
ncbi:MAG: hypothetical protein MI741_22690, partial [Rhodospirillales bacterium]|nr:hypothetical protein [Rhodospirillales bacterium]